MDGVGVAVPEENFDFLPRTLGGFEGDRPRLPFALEVSVTVVSGLL